jgi:hypothetical protein
MLIIGYSANVEVSDASAPTPIDFHHDPDPDHIHRRDDAAFARSSAPGARGVKVLAYLLLLVVLAGITWSYPFLFELPILGAIGGAYWLFFRSTGTVHDDRAD